jgi:hypothetical protein
MEPWPPAVGFIMLANPSRPSGNSISPMLYLKPRTFYITFGVGFVLFALIVVGVLKRRAASHASTGSLVGQVISPETFAEELHFPEHSETIAIALRSACHFCEQERPFYLQLLATAKVAGAPSCIRFITPDSKGVFYSFLPNVPTDQVSTEVPLWVIGVRSTPTILVIRDGRVERAWVGALVRGEERKAVTDELLRAAREANHRTKALDTSTVRVP